MYMNLVDIAKSLKNKINHFSLFGIESTRRRRPNPDFHSQFFWFKNHIDIFKRNIEFKNWNVFSMNIMYHFALF